MTTTEPRLADLSLDDLNLALDNWRAQYDAAMFIDHWPRADRERAAATEQIRLIKAEIERRTANA